MLFRYLKGKSKAGDISPPEEEVPTPVITSVIGRENYLTVNGYIFEESKIDIAIATPGPNGIDITYSVSSESQVNSIRWRVNNGSWNAIQQSSGVVHYDYTDYTITEFVFDFEAITATGTISNSAETSIWVHTEPDLIITSYEVNLTSVDVTIRASAPLSDNGVIATPVNEVLYRLRSRDSSNNHRILIDWTSVDSINYPIPHQGLRTFTVEYNFLGNTNYFIDAYAKNLRGGSSGDDDTISFVVDGAPVEVVWTPYTESINEPLSWEPVNEVEMTDHAGFAGVRCIGTGNHPSPNPNDWVLFKDGHAVYNCLDMVNPNMGLPSRNEYPRFWKVKGGVGALWGGSYDSSAQPTGSLGRAARTKKIGEHWNNSHNQMRRVINKSLPWAGDHRRMNPTLHYDPINRRYVSFFGERKQGGSWDGIRCIGSCWTTTPHIRESWQYKEDWPVLTHATIRELYPELMQPQVSNNNWDHARMYPEFSFYYEGKHYFYLNAAIWTRSATGNNYENIDMIVATTDYTRHDRWEKVDNFDWSKIRRRRDAPNQAPDGAVNPSGGFWGGGGSNALTGLKSMTYYDGFWYANSRSNRKTAEVNGRGPALYRAPTPFGPWEIHGPGDFSLIQSPYPTGIHSKGNLILYRDVWFIFCSIRDDGQDPNTSALSTKYAGANVNRAYRVIFGGYYDPFNKINSILNS